MLFCLLMAAAVELPCTAQTSPPTDPASEIAALPDAPPPQTTTRVETPASATESTAVPCAKSTPTVPGKIENAAPDASHGAQPGTAPCRTRPLNWYQRFADGPQVKPLTARDKAWLAARNVADPFNIITIAGDAGIAVASDAHSVYGPGMHGVGNYMGVSFAEDITGEFIGTWLIPSVTHQDPHYHRMPGFSIPRRAWHAMAQVLWTQSDTGLYMPNYANIIGFAADDEIADCYVPGRETNLRASAERYAIGLATAPIGNWVNEFLPDVASHIHVQIVIVQRIINQFANKETMNNTGSPATGFDE